MLKEEKEIKNCEKGTGASQTPSAKAVSKQTPKSGQGKGWSTVQRKMQPEEGKDILLQSQFVLVWMHCQQWSPKCV